MVELFVGIDGGGTGCRVAVADRQGHILGRGKGGAANILSAPDASLANMIDATRQAFAAAGLDQSSIAAASALLGLAGNNVGDAVHYIRAKLPFRQAAIESDALIALQGALGHGDGIVGTLGTGSVYVLRRAKAIRFVGGWGFAVGDLGSGARLGQALLQESLLGYDGICARTPLLDEVLAEFGGDPGGIVEFGRAASPGDFGRYAPRLFDHARQGDATALRLIGEGAGQVSAALDACLRHLGDENGAICLLGGLAKAYDPYLAERHRARLILPQADALTGAVALAVQRFALPMGDAA